MSASTEQECVVIGCGREVVNQGLWCRKHEQPPHLPLKREPPTSSAVWVTVDEGRSYRHDIGPREWIGVTIWDRGTGWVHFRDGRQIACGDEFTLDLAKARALAAAAGPRR